MTVQKGKFEVVLPLSLVRTPFGLDELAGLIRGDDGYAYSFTVGVMLRNGTGLPGTVAVGKDAWFVPVGTAATYVSYKEFEKL